MKELIRIILVIFAFILITVPSYAWSNGGYSTDINNPVNGTHDFLLEKAINMLPSEMKNRINNSVAYYGSETPDCTKNIYCIGDVASHHVYYYSNGSVQADSSAVRAREEYDLAKSYLQSNDTYNFSLHLGAMSHYISDVAVFGHTMGAKTDWGAEVHHSAYESYVNNHLNSFGNVTFDGNVENIDAYNATLKLAKETTFDGGIYTNKWMDVNYGWTNSLFTERTQILINSSVNLLSDTIYSLLIESQITTNTEFQGYPAISGKRMVYEDDRNGNLDIYMYDLSTNTEKQVTTNTENQGASTISGKRIVWQDYRNGNLDIYMYDLSTNTEKQITTNTARQNFPKISGKRIVYEDDRNGNDDIYMYDLSTNTEKQITTNTENQWWPAISGKRIVYADLRNGNWGIYMYDLSTNTEKQITSNTAMVSPPSISGKRIVYADDRNGNWDIYMYDLSTNTEKQITTNTAGQGFPDISGKRIVYGDYRNGNDDIYMYDLSTNTEKQITTNTVNQTDPAISGKRIVYGDDRNGNWNIYMYRLQ